MTQLNKQDWICQSGKSHNFVTHVVNKYVTCTHNAQIRQVSIWKMLVGGDNTVKYKVAFLTAKNIFLGQSIIADHHFGNLRYSFLAIKNNLWYITVCLKFKWCLSLVWLCYICLFDLILYIPVNNQSVMSGRVFLGWTNTKLGLMCLAQGHNAVMLVRLEPAALQSRVKHSTTEPPRIMMTKYYEVIIFYRI